jgi:hypothetical protein
MAATVPRAIEIVLLLDHLCPCMFIAAFLLGAVTAFVAIEDSMSEQKYPKDRARNQY